MPLLRAKMIVPLALAFIATMVVTSAAPSNSLQAALSPATASEQREARRIHAHFDSVLNGLAARDVSGLTQSQQTNRRQLITVLSGYNNRGMFPHNYDFRTPRPYFVDRKTGTLCAVAYLLESTGRRHIVDRVARANNNVWVADLKGDTALASWLDERGITLDEAARIQVPYMGDQGLVGDLQSSSTPLAYVVVGGTLATAATSVGMTAWNLIGNSDGHGKKRAVVGLVSGLATSVFGAVIFGQGESGSVNRPTGAVGVTIGAVGMAAATRSLLHRSTYLAAQREQESVKRATWKQTLLPPANRKNRGNGSLRVDQILTRSSTARTRSCVPTGFDR